MRVTIRFRILYSSNFLPRSIKKLKCPVFCAQAKLGLLHCGNDRVLGTWLWRHLFLVTGRDKGRWGIFIRGSSRCVLPNIQYINNGQYTTRAKSRCLLQLGYTWRHVSAVKRPSSGQHRIILLRYSHPHTVITTYVLTSTVSPVRPAYNAWI